MKQQVNLYLAEFKLKKDALTVRLMAQVLGATIALMVLISAYDFFTRWQLNTELVELRLTLQEETRKTSELDGLLARRSQDAELSDRLDLAEARLDSGRQVRDFLSETKLGNEVGFSEHFKDLSRASIDGLSLTEFSISEGGDRLRLLGRVVESAMVPRYVKNLELSTSPIRNQHFGTTIALGEQYYSFALSTSDE